jgi:hypothetical protein
MEERQTLWASRGRGEAETEGLEGITVGCFTDKSAPNANGSGH